MLVQVEQLVAGRWRSQVIDSLGAGIIRERRFQLVLKRGSYRVDPNPAGMRR